MAWCPLCKNEYREGVVECSECHVPLVNELKEGRRAIYFDTEEKLEKIVKFFIVNDIKTASIHYDEKEEISELYVSEADESRAKKVLRVFIKEEEKEDGTQSKSEEETVKEMVHPKQPAGAFVSKRHKAEDHKSSAYVLIFVGIVGIVALVLIEGGIIPLSLPATTKYMSYFLMGALFLAFLVMGIFSVKSYKKLAGEAATEEDEIENARKWLRDTITKDYLQNKIADNVIEQEEANDKEETIYFVRTEYIAEAIRSQFSHFDEILVEQLADDYYSEVYE